MLDNSHCETEDYKRQIFKSTDKTIINDTFHHVRDYGMKLYGGISIVCKKHNVDGWYTEFHIERGRCVDACNHSKIKFCPVCGERLDGSVFQSYYEEKQKRKFTF